MRNILFAAFCLALLSAAAFAQSNRATRPRIAASPTPPQINNEPSASTGEKRPPVLRGAGRTTAEMTTDEADTAEMTDDDDIIKLETTLVTLPVSVLDRNGRFVSGLQQRDFRIFEDGIEQKLDYFLSVEQPFTVVLLLDVSNSTQFQITEIQDAAITFVDQLRRDDRVMVISFDEKVRVLSRPTNDRYQLRNAIRQANFGGGTSLYDAVDEVINRQLRFIKGRKAIVVFSDGVDTTSRRADYQSTLRDAEEIDALIYPIRYDTFRDMRGSTGGGGAPFPRRSGRVTIGDVIGIILGGGNVAIGGGGGTRGTSREDYENGRRYLEELAQKSGGRNFEASDTYNLDIAFRSIAEELRRQYSIGYYPEKIGQKGDRKQIRVRVMRPNLVVRAKTSYIVGESEKTMAGK